MTTENITLFQALGAKMDFLNQRQRVIAQNIANADTPGYRPKDMKPVDFSSVLKNVGNTGRQNVHLESTKSGHMPPPNDVHIDDPRKQKRTYEVAPAGNAVIMEEQLLNSGRTVSDYTLMTNLLRKNMGLIGTALGRQQ
jgi:flagellar basal-body rod protein FlgB